MKHRERVAMALAHEIPDCCPMQISFTPEFAVRLRHDLEQRGMLETPRDGIQEHNLHGGGNTYELERTIDNDLILTSVGWANSYYQEQSNYTDEWGIGWRSIEYETKFGTGRYTEIAHHPLAEDHAIDRYTPPGPQRDELYREAEWTLKTFRDEYWIVGVTVTTVFETAWALRGLDVLNPVQPASMDPVKLKDEYGDRLCFWGSIDEQQTLPFGSPKDVRQEVLTRLRTLGRRGGLILGPTHHVQLDTPMENFWAMTDTIKETLYTQT